MAMRGYLGEQELRRLGSGADGRWLSMVREPGEVREVCGPREFIGRLRW